MWGKLANKLNSNEKPSTPVVEGKIHYKFQCGYEAHQEELSLEQDEKLTAILLTLNLSSLAEISINELITTLTKEKLIPKVLGIILIGKEDNDYSKLKNSELEMVMADFFSLNPTAIAWLKTIGEGLASLKMIPSTSNLPKESEQSKKDYPDSDMKI